MKKNLMLFMVICLVITLSGGCVNNGGDNSPVNKSKNVTVVFVPKLTGNAFFESANNGAQEYAGKYGFTVRYEGSPQAEVDDQIAVIESAIEQKADALCVSSLDAKALDPVMKEAMAAGIKVTTWDSDVSGDARSIMVSQGTPEQLGRMLVEMGAKSLINRGKNITKDTIRYTWHYSQSSVTDQNSWQMAGEEYISKTYPNWKNVEPDNYYSMQNPDKALKVGKTIIKDNPGIDLIICNDSTSLPGQAKAAQSLGLKSKDITITGFASPNAMREYCKDEVLERWGLWDCKIQGALGCYMAYLLAAGNELKVGDRVDVPEIGTVEVMPNTVLAPESYTAADSGVVLLPNRSEYTIDNVDDYDF